MERCDGCDREIDESRLAMCGDCNDTFCEGCIYDHYDVEHDREREEDEDDD